jgi:hypothetical protein
LGSGLWLSSLASSSVRSVVVNDTPIRQDRGPWPHRPRRRKRPCNSGSPPAPANDGRNWPESMYGSAARSPTSPQTCPTATGCP